LKNYCKGLLLPGERKSIEPMAAPLDGENIQSMRQSLHHLVAKAPWQDEVLLEQVRNYVLPAMQKHGPVVAWIVDDTGFPKKGKHSVGVTRQYCGQVGKQENCRVAVSLSVATWSSSLPVEYRLYLPKEWAEDAERREKTEVPEEVEFQTKPAIALDQIRAAVAANLDRGVVLAEGLRDQYGISRRAHRTRVAICGGCAEFHDSLGARQTAFTRQATRKNGKTSAAVTALYRPPTCLGEAVSDEVAHHRIPGNHLA
jgi:SRSO17 transposase